MRIGPYEILSEVGRGGMGVVYRARSPEGGDVAVKLLSKRDPENLARFEREKRLQRGLGEVEGFVPLVAAGDSERGPYLVMPFLAGGTLRQRLDRGIQGVDETLALGTALARSLGHAHAAGVVHRDMKPENVLFTAAGRPLVADLGLAKHFGNTGPGASQSVVLSLAGGARGTAGYMAPEQTADARSAGPAADVFALGAILYECLAGRPAFRGETVLELLTTVLEGRIEPLAVLRPDAPTWLRAVVARALETDPLKRFADAAALAAALAPPAASPGARRRAWPVVVLVLLAGAVAWSLTPRRTPPAREPEPALAPVGSSAPVVPRREPLPELPAFCTPYARSPHLLLTACFGDPRWRHASNLDAPRFVDGSHLITMNTGPHGITEWDLTTGTGEDWPGSFRYVKLAQSSSLGRMVGGRSDGTLDVWDMRRRTIVRTFGSGSGRLETLALSPDGRRVVSGYMDGSTFLSDVETGETHPFAEHPGGGVYLSFGTGVIAVGVFDGSIHIHDMTGRTVKRLLFTIAGIHALEVSPDGTRLLTGDNAGAVACWDLETEAVLWSAGGAPCMDVAFSADGKRTLSVHRDGTVMVREASSGASIASFERGHAMSGGTFSPDGLRICLSGMDGLIEVLDAASGAVLSPQGDGHRSGVKAVAFTPDGKLAVSAGTDRTVRVWDLETSGLRRVLLAGEKVHALAPLPDGKRVLAGCDRELDLLDLETGVLLRRTVLDVNVHALAMLADGKRVLVGAGKALEVRDAETGTVVRSSNAHTGDLHALALTRDSQRAFTGAVRDPTVRAWEMSGGTELRALTVKGILTGLAVSPDGLWLLGSTQHEVSLWHLRPRESIPIDQEGEVVNAVAISPDGKTGVAVGASVRLIALPEGRIFDQISLEDPGLSVAFAPDGRTFLVGMTRGMCLRYRLETTVAPR